jgi:hypothetical protein
VGKKAKRKSTTTQPVAKPPLHSSDWWPWRRAVECTRERMGSRDVGDAALTVAVNRGDVWIKVEAIDFSADPPAQISEIVEAPKIVKWLGQPVIDLRRPDQHTFFAWGPNLQRLWPAPAAESSDVAVPRSIPRQPSGPKTARSWQDHVLREIVRAVRAGRPQPPASELARSCYDCLTISVEPTAINKFLRDVDAGR